MPCHLTLALKFTRDEERSLLVMIHASRALRNIVGVRYARDTVDVSSTTLAALLQVDTMNFLQTISFHLVPPQSRFPLQVVSEVGSKCHFLQHLAISWRFSKAQDVKEVGEVFSKFPRLMSVNLLHSAINDGSSSSSSSEFLLDEMFPVTLREINLVAVGYGAPQDRRIAHVNVTFNPALVQLCMKRFPPHCRVLQISDSAIGLHRDAVLPESIAMISIRNCCNVDNFLLVELPWKNLERFSVTGSRWRSLPTTLRASFFHKFSGHVKLRVLDLSRTPLNDVHIDMRAFPVYLQELRLTGCRLSGDLQFSDVPCSGSLRLLDLSLNPYITLAATENFECLRYYHALETLNLEGLSSVGSATVTLNHFVRNLPKQIVSVCTANTGLCFPVDSAPDITALQHLTICRKVDFGQSSQRTMPSAEYCWTMAALEPLKLMPALQTVGLAGAGIGSSLMQDLERELQKRGVRFVQ